MIGVREHVKHPIIASLLALIVSGLNTTPAESQPRLPTTGGWTGPVATCQRSYVVLEASTYVYGSQGITWGARDVPTPTDWLVRLPVAPWFNVPAYPVPYPIGPLRRRAAFAVDAQTLMANAWNWGTTAFANASAPTFFRGMTGDLYLIVGQPSVNAPHEREITVLADQGAGHPFMHTTQVESLANPGERASYFHIREGYGWVPNYVFQDQVTISCATHEEFTWSPPDDLSRIPTTVHGTYPYRQRVSALWRASLVRDPVCGWQCVMTDVPF
ncbi:hypothetical protein KBD34_01525 [Patescibacteria group bacterium]|nr:hypothetical protein [Patescibacteria group bacterium]